MSAGSVQYVIKCVPTGTAQSFAPCTAVGSSGYGPVMTQAYVIDPASASYIDALTVPFDYAYASGLFTLSFSMVVGLFVVSRYAGVILDFIRRG